MSDFITCDFEGFVQRSQLAVLVFTTETATDFLLMNAREFRLDPAFPRFIGAVGVIEGRFATMLKEPLDAATITALSRSFADYLGDSLAEHLPGGASERTTN